jgi:signal transduction histidine kinase
MNRRLLVSYASLVLLVLVVLEVPLAVYYSRNERNVLADKVERDAVALGSVAEGAFEQPPEVPPASLQGLAVRYERQTGGRVVIVNYPRAVSVADSAGPPGASFVSRPEIRRALGGHVAQGVRYSHTLGVNLLYVAVPVASAGAIHGAVRVTYPTSAVDARIHRYWLILTGIGAIVFVLALLLALTLARWISRPLRDVEAAAVAAGEGDLSARAPAGQGPPEVRALAGAINETVAKLEQVLESQQAFVADASHQLRTPLTALRLRLENLEGDVSEVALAGALNEVDRLARLVNGLLALARADAAAVPGPPVSAGEAVEKRLQAWSDLAAERGIRLEAVVEEDALARTSSERLDQVLDNLISNALEASPRGSSVLVSAVRAEDAIELHVVDKGPGLSEQDRRRAFDRFWKGQGGSGSGLGLAIVKRLVVADGGEVELRPAPGGGIDAVVRLRPASSSGPVPILAGSLSGRRT